MAADDDDLARLMKEIEEFDKSSGAAPAAPTPQPTGSAEVAKKQSSEVAERGSGSRAKWAAIAAVGAGVVGFLVGSVLFILPGVDGWSTGLGAALGGAVVAFVSGPPKWLR